jgi:hypothetical protein
MLLWEGRTLMCVSSCREDTEPTPRFAKGTAPIPDATHFWENYFPQDLKNQLTNMWPLSAKHTTEICDTLLGQALCRSSMDHRPDSLAFWQFWRMCIAP